MKLKLNWVPNAEEAAIKSYFWAEHKLTEYVYQDEVSGLVVVSSYRPTSDCYIRVCMTERVYKYLKSLCYCLDKQFRQIGTVAKLFDCGVDMTAENVQTNDIAKFAVTRDLVDACDHLARNIDTKQLYIATYDRNLKETGEYGIDQETLLVGAFDNFGLAELALSDKRYFGKGNVRLYTGIAIVETNKTYAVDDAPVISCAYYLE